MVGNDKYVLKYSRVEGFQGQLTTLSPTNYVLTPVQLSPHVRLLLVAGDGKFVHVYLDNIWLIGVLLL
jgi:hypothetical protein